MAFRTKDGACVRLQSLEFLRRLAQHILPPRFVRIRHLGLYAAGNVATKLEVARACIEAPPVLRRIRPPLPSTAVELLILLTGRDPRQCPHCGGEMTPRPWPDHTFQPPGCDSSCLRKARSPSLRWPLVHLTRARDGARALARWFFPDDSHRCSAVCLFGSTADLCSTASTRLTRVLFPPARLRPRPSFPREVHRATHRATPRRARSTRHFPPGDSAPGVSTQLRRRRETLRVHDAPLYAGGRELE